MQAYQQDFWHISAMWLAERLEGSFSLANLQGGSDHAPSLQEAIRFCSDLALYSDHACHGSNGQYPACLCRNYRDSLSLATVSSYSGLGNQSGQDERTQVRYTHGVVNLSPAQALALAGSRFRQDRGALPVFSSASASSLA
jgi:hypothetical protein